jgi:hypothetical protein
MMYRRETNLSAGTAYLPPPDWLLDGIPMRQPAWDEGRLIGVLEASVNAQRILPLEEFLRPRKLSGLDGPGRSLYKAYSFALVDLLTRLHDGRACLRHFIANIAFASNEPMVNLGKHFPELSDAGGAERAWRSQITRLATIQPFRLLRTEETEQKLEELLALRISGAGPERKCHLDEFPKFIRNASSRLAFLQCTRDLSILATRANPIYRPLIHEYARIATLLARGKTSGIAERLARLSASRKSNVTTMRKIDDYLNWFEVAKPLGPSGAFAGYMKAAEWAPQPEEKRRDAISVYLDVLEAQFQD